MDDCQLDDASVACLVRRAASGDAAAFAAIYDAYAPRVRRFLRRESGDTDLAEELLQRTFVKMIEALPRYRERGLPFGAWVFRIARNTVIDNRRTSHPALALDLAIEQPTERGNPVAFAERRADHAWLLAALEGLPAAQRDVLVWRYFAELSPAETAHLMGRTCGAVRVLQHRALLRLRSKLQHAAREWEDGKLAIGDGS